MSTDNKSPQSFLMPVDLADRILKYLLTRPCSEVLSLVNRIMSKECRFVEDEPEPGVPSAPFPPPEIPPRAEDSN